MNAEPEQDVVRFLPGVESHEALQQAISAKARRERINQSMDFGLKRAPRDAEAPRETNEGER